MERVNPSSSRAGVPPLRVPRAGYVRQLSALLPQGAAWTAKDDPTSILRRLLEALASALSPPHNRGLDLVDEALPAATRELLTDWEQTAGLPDNCTAGQAVTLEERRAALVAKLTLIGEQSIGFFERLARSLGYEAEIIEHRPFVCGHSQVGGSHPLGALRLRHAWRLKVSDPRVTWFRCGVSACGIDPLARITRAQDLECLVHRLKPAHSHLTVGYEGG